MENPVTSTRPDMWNDSPEATAWRRIQVFGTPIVEVTTRPVRSPRQQQAAKRNQRDADVEFYLTSGYTADEICRMLGTTYGALYRSLERWKKHELAARLRRAMYGTWRDDAA